VRPTIDGRPQSAQDIGSAAVDPDMLSRVSRILDAIRPTIQSDGGDVELVGGRLDLIQAAADILGQAGVSFAPTERGFA
jgi:hypothetical protein